MKSIIKNLFLSNQDVCQPGPTPQEFYFSISIFNSTQPLFFCEVIENDKSNGDSLAIVSNVEELMSFQEECTFQPLWCCIPGCLSNSGRREFEEVHSIERSVIQSNNGDAEPIYKLKFKNGMEVIYDLADTEYPAEVLVFEPYISYPFIQRNKPH